MGSKAMKWIWLSVVCTFPLQFHEMGYRLIVWNRIVTKHTFTKYTDSERELLHSVDSSCLPYETVHFPSSHVPSPSNSQHLPPNRFFLLSSASTPINRINISLPSSRSHTTNEEPRFHPLPSSTPQSITLVNHLHQSSSIFTPQPTSLLEESVIMSNSRGQIHVNRSFTINGTVYSYRRDSSGSEAGSTCRWE